jgi:hypothetical protein
MPFGLRGTRLTSGPGVAHPEAAAAMRITNGTTKRSEARMKVFAEQRACHAFGLGSHAEFAVSTQAINPD